MNYNKHKLLFDLNSLINQFIKIKMKFTKNSVLQNRPLRVRVVQLINLHINHTSFVQNAYNDLPPRSHHPRFSTSVSTASFLL